MRDNAKEEGFLGSTLLGGKRKRDEGSRSEETSRSENNYNNADWKCETCTLINPGDDNTCAACTSARPVQDNESKRKRSRSESGLEGESDDEQRLMKRQRVDKPSESNNNGHNNHNKDEGDGPDAPPKNLTRSFGNMIRKAGEFFDNLLQSENSVEKPVPHIKVTGPPSPKKKITKNGEDDADESLFEEFQLGAPSNGKKN